MARLTPYPHQLAGIDYGKRVRDAMLFMPPRTGKGHPNSKTLPLFGGGFKRVGDIVPGDLVIGSDGSGNKVLEVHPLGVREIFKVSFSSGVIEYVTEDHLWEVVWCKRNIKRVVTTLEIKDRIEKQRKNKWPKLPRVEYCAPVQYIKKELPLDPYLLGVILGDGCISGNSVQISCYEEDVVGKVLLLCSSYYNADNHLINTQGVSSIIKGLGLRGTKSASKFIPTEYLYSCVEDRLQLLRGLLDTDGYVEGGRNSRCVEYGTSSKQLADGVIHLVRSLGGRATCTTRTPTYTYLGDKRTGQLAYRIRISMLGDLVPVSSKKHLRKWGTKSGRKYNVITNVEPAGYSEEATCISVEAEDKLYLTENYTVTHNTLTSLRIVEGKAPVLIISPATVLATWHSALVEEGIPEENIVVMDDRYTGTAKEKRNLLLLPDTTHVIINFEKVVRTDALFIRQDYVLKKVLPLLDWQVVILDESYRISNMESGITEYLLSRPKPLYQQRLLLSGFPVCESALDLAPQAIFCRGEFFGFTDPLAYREAYWREIPEAYKWVPKNGLHKYSIQKWSKDNAFSVSLEELGLGGELLRSKALIPITEEQIKLMRIVALSEVYRLPGDDPETEARPMLSTVRAIFFQKIASGIHPYDNSIIADTKQKYILEKYKAEREPILVLSRFRAPMHHLLEILEAEGFSVGLIDGAVGLRERERIRSGFQSGIIDIVIAQVKTIKMGLDFSRLTTILYLSNSFSFDDRAQSELRGQNVKRTDPYNIIDICTETTTDIDISDTLVIKGKDATKYLPEINMKQIQLYKEAQNDA